MQKYWTGMIKAILFINICKGASTKDFRICQQHLVVNSCTPSLSFLAAIRIWNSTKNNTTWSYNSQNFIHYDIILCNIIYIWKTDINLKHVQMWMGICVCTCVIVLKSKDGKYPSVFQTIYKQEGNYKRAFYNDSQLD